MTQALPQASDSVRIIKPLPAYVVTVMCWLFAILFGIWALPHTVSIRHTCMVLGSMLGLYVIGYLWRNGLLKMQVNAVPIFLILALFIWVTIHLLWIGQAPDLQWREYARAWKKIFITFPFALGLGLGIRYVIELGDENLSRRLWRIMYFALLLPALIFFIKFGLTEWSKVAQFVLSPYLVLSQDWSFSSGMPKYFYVFFCLPVFAIAIGAITHAVFQNTLSLKTHAIYFGTVLIVPIIFYHQTVRNGMAYAAVIVVIALLILGYSILIRGTFKKKIIFAGLAILLFVIATASLKANPAWRMLLADIKVAIQLDKVDNWKYQGQSGIPYPINEYGVPVNPSNYERATWALAGLKLTKENPLGYGLMTLSFDHLTKTQWPNSFMSQTHSAWLDFALGYGIPGVALLVVALALAWRNSRFLKDPWPLVGRWGLGVLGLVMCSTEISSEIFINALIFMVVMATGLTMSMKLNKQSIKVTR
jgi:hypothetical protein